MRPHIAFVLVIAACGSAPDAGPMLVEVLPDMAEAADLARGEAVADLAALPDLATLPDLVSLPDMVPATDMVQCTPVGEVPVGKSWCCYDNTVARTAAGTVACCITKGSLSEGSQRCHSDADCCDNNPGRPSYCRFVIVGEGKCEYR